MKEMVALKKPAEHSHLEDTGEAMDAYWSKPCEMGEEKETWVWDAEGDRVCVALSPAHAEYIAAAMNTYRDLEDIVAAERERWRQLFLAYAFDAHGWKLKDGSRDAVREMLEDIDSGAVPHQRFLFREDERERWVIDVDHR